MPGEIEEQELSDQVRDVNTPLGNIREVDSVAGSQVAVTGAAALTTSTDEAYTFDSPVNHVWVQNNSTTTVHVAFDEVATAGSLNVVENALGVFDCPCAVVHLYSAATTAVNGNGAANIVVKGWL